MTNMTASNSPSRLANGRDATGCACVTGEFKLFTIQETGASSQMQNQNGIYNRRWRELPFTY